MNLEKPAKAVGVEPLVRADYVSTLYYLQSNRNVGHTRLLIDAAIRNPEFIIIAHKVSLAYINGRIGRIQAITMSELKNVSNKPIVFDNSLITNLLMEIVGNDQYIPIEWQ